MVSIKEATANALSFALDTLGPERTTDVRLEEIESTQASGEDAWAITLSMMTRDSAAASLAGATSDALAAYLGKLVKREYKSFTVRKRDGEVLEMKIRELAEA